MAEEASDTTRGKSSGQFASLVRGTTVLVLGQLVIAVFATVAMVWAFLTLPDLQEKRDAAVTEALRAKAEVEGLEKSSVTLHAEIASLAQRKAGMEEALPYIQAGAEFLLRKEPAVAINYFDSALTRLPNDPFITAQLAMAQFRVGKVELAREKMQKAIAADPLKERNYIELAGFFCAERNAAQAVETLSNAPSEVKAALAEDPALILENSFVLETCGQAMTTRLAGLFQDVAPGKSEAFRIKRLYVQVRRAEDVPAVRRIVDQLKTEGYIVDGIDVVSAQTTYRSSVRFYYDVQAPQATLLKDFLLKAAASANVQVGAEELMTINLQGRFKNLPRDVAEVWF